MSKKITSPEDLATLRRQSRKAMNIRTPDKEIQVTVHMGTCGLAAGAREVATELAEALLESAVENVSLKESGCVGLCDKEPMITVTERSGRQYRYGKLDRQKVIEVVQEHLINGEPLVDYIVRT